MKKLIIILSLIVVSSFIIGQAAGLPKKSQDSARQPAAAPATKVTTTRDTSSNFWSGHNKQAIDCKMCHSCEYPTKGDPCLTNCPKSKMISVYHRPEEGPEIVYMNQIKGNEGYTIFSHKMHAQMAEISGRCSNCHHYNTTGPVLKCSKCHEANRKREDISKPDLKGAYHRQCMNCHRQWEGKVQCENCHIPDGPKGDAKKNAILAELSGKSHPRVQEPVKIVFETNYNKGKMVTFFHGEHIKIFNLDCNSCHKEDNCTKCHSKANDGRIASGQPFKIHKSLEEHHKPCSSCHASDTKNNCGKCHSGSEAAPFDHGKKTGWPLTGMHSTLSCDRCHGSQAGKFTKPSSNCTSCHKNFAPGKFNHKAAGIVLSENHSDLDCESCHIDKKFNVRPACDGCHDDKSYPKNVPGKRVGAKK